ncbi:phage tail length tape measure family protein [Cognatiyoonia sp. IB215182]|uniref:phage tail length tape measure family protein n=1 Tax=Cognatiyoonia sp. IB215182 TaxID=3097353 RepID=UPI002A10D663|nr:phage tail length tape measure family protein [Cognatiyoonia sp. IB215182]MDX8354360.1 phage tail length tape measure family protein [Cognatiyoonia sp. IB215182]
MTDYRVGLRIEGDSASGEQALNRTDAALDKAGRSARAMGQETRRAGTETQRLGREADKTARETRELSQAEERAAAASRALAAANRRAATSARTVGREKQIAAGHTGNLIAQFNDIGVMLASGQSPLLLAVQQGTQITQVIGPMGAAGAAKALGGAFLGMINPLSLATLGIIAGGAALVQWAARALSAGEEASAFEERLDGVTQSMAALNAEARQARYGATEEELTLLDGISAKNREIAQLQERIRDTQGHRRRVAQQNLKDAIAERDAFQAQLATLQERQRSLDEFIASTDTLADIERELGDQMGVTAAQLAENEALVRLMQEGIKANVIQQMELAGIDIASPIAEAVAEAAKLASELGISFQTASDIIALNAEGVSGPDAAIAQLDQARGPVRNGLRGVVSTQTFDSGRTNRTSRGRGAATSEADRQRRAVTDLIASLEQELAIQRELDPVQQEMIRHRETLGAATDAEREKVEELIATRAREAEAMELARENLAEWRDLTADLLDDLIQSGGNLESVLSNLSGLLVQMIQQAALLGTGPLAGAFGTAGGGGALDQFFGAILPAGATGGRIVGPGDGRSDDVLMWGSSGETIMNARATRRYGPLLDAMNGDAVVPGFRDGGRIAASSTSQPVFGGVNISIENHSSTPVTGEVEEQPDGSGGRKYTLVLADQVGAALVTRGGGARRTLQQTYGVRQRGSRR